MFFYYYYCPFFPKKLWADFFRAHFPPMFFFTPMFRLSLFVAVTAVGQKSVAVADFGLDRGGPRQSGVWLKLLYVTPYRKLNRNFLSTGPASNKLKNYIYFFYLHLPWYLNIDHQNCIHYTFFFGRGDTFWHFWSKRVEKYGFFDFLDFLSVLKNSVSKR